MQTLGPTPLWCPYKGGLTIISLLLTSSSIPSNWLEINKMGEISVTVNEVLNSNHVRWDNLRKSRKDSRGVFLP